MQLMYLIDTNVISEIRKGNKANVGVRLFFDEITKTSKPVFLSVITIGELRRGVDLIYHCGDMTQGRVLEIWLNKLLTQYQEHILPIDGETSLLWGRLLLPNPQHALDKLIAATALIYDFTVVTRNTDDFQNTGVRLLNPFTEG